MLWHLLTGSAMTPAQELKYRAVKLKQRVTIMFVHKTDALSAALAEKWLDKTSTPDPES